jgi:hypothetical protein
MLPPIAERFSRPTEQTNFRCRSGEIAKMKFCPQHPMPTGIAAHEISAASAINPARGVRKMIAMDLATITASATATKRQVGQLGQARSCDRQTCERSEQKAWRVRSQPLQNAKEQRAEAERREHVVVHCVEHILRNESQQQRHADAQIHPPRGNRASGYVA